MRDSNQIDGISHAAWTALYQTASQQWTHAEQIRWTLLYNYLMASTILLLAWSAVFAPSDHSFEKAVVLALLAFAGISLSALWVALGLRATGFVRRYAAAGCERSRTHQSHWYFSELRSSGGPWPMGHSPGFLRLSARTFMVPTMLCSPPTACLRAIITESKPRLV
jgi:hypothetical protein